MTPARTAQWDQIGGHLASIDVLLREIQHGPSEGDRMSYTVVRGAVSQAVAALPYGTQRQPAAGSGS